MRTSDFDYKLPLELIAQTPAEPRDSSRLLVVHRETGALEHRVFSAIGEYLRPGDVLVRNDTRVVPARLVGERPGTGGRVQALLLRQTAPGVWEALVKPSARLRAGAPIHFRPANGGDVVEASVEAVLAEGTRLLRFPPGVLPQYLGEVPLPPYITTPLANPDRYQTVYAREEGSAAAPTAGLHFTPRLLQELEDNGVEVVSVTLHVGLDTFRPVRHDDPREHGIHTEHYTLAPEAADHLTQAAAEGRRIIAVGTTSVRSLEDAVRRSGWQPGLPRAQQPSVQAYTGPTSLYLLPGSPFLTVDGMITNFHLPRTTLLMLVSAFAGRELMLHAYVEAMRLRYRFYSFGDALLLM
ncbi:MAG: tRNA preQ1(34) S-adenosylmethionine ribosyltransferase-isomerase QueA [Dehalococcoidia bacterium]|nr:tRNA preQ1(34) S-adenosylmethionine ribosyltransferase-isomerase QueA [Dehalococcoidia bacterium]